MLHIPVYLCEYLTQLNMTQDQIQREYGSLVKLWERMMGEIWTQNPVMSCRLHSQIVHGRGP